MSARKRSRGCERTQAARLSCSPCGRQSREQRTKDALRRLGLSKQSARAPCAFSVKLEYNKRVRYICLSASKVRPCSAKHKYNKRVRYICLSASKVQAASKVQVPIARSLSRTNITNVFAIFAFPRSEGHRQGLWHLTERQRARTG